MKALTLTSSFPKSKSSHEGIFIQDLVRYLSERAIIPIVLAPHFPGGSLSDVQGNILLYRFRYFFPAGYERLAYGSGFANNIRQDPLAFLQILPYVLAQFLSSLLLIREKKPDIIHSHWLIPQGLNGAILHKFLRIPHLTSIHGTDLNLIKNHSILKIICRFILRNTDLVTVNSHYMLQNLLAVEPGCREKTMIIPMGVDPDRWWPAFPSKKKEFRADHIILNIGRLIDWKGTIHLIEALPAVLKKYPGAILLIIGEGPEKDHLQTRVQHLSLEKQVKFLGIVGNQEMAVYYHAADVFVLPSVLIAGRTEGLGVVLLEAMASGCPVIGSNVGGIPDIITDGKDGFLVPEGNPEVIADRIIRLLSDPVLAKQFSENGRRTVLRKFAWASVSEKFARLYMSLVNQKPVEGGR